MESKDFYLDAIFELYGNTGYYNSIDIMINENDVFRVATSEELIEIEAKAAQLLVIYNNTAYKRNREKEVRHSWRLFKLLYEDGINNTTNFNDRMAHIINKHPGNA